MKDEENPAMLTIPDYFEKNLAEIAQFYSWPIDDDGSYRSYEKEYAPVLAVIRRHGGMTSISEWEPVELENMLQKAQDAGYNHGTERYADSTVDTWRAFLRKVYKYAEFAGHSADKMQYLEIIKKRTSSIGIAKRNVCLKDRQKEYAKVFRKRRNERRSLSPSQLQIVIEKAIDMLLTNGIALAILILIYTGLRPSEVLGLKVGDYVRYVEKNEYFLTIVRQVDAHGYIKNRLKRNASYRKVPVHFELRPFIEKRIALIQANIPKSAKLMQCPLCCWGNSFLQHCKPYRLSSFAREFLSAACVEDRVYENALLDLYVTEPELDKPEAEEYDCHTYLLRHTFWTMVQSSSELTADEKRVLFGHAVWHDGKEINADFNYEVILYRMHKKLEHIVFYPPAHQPFMVALMKEGEHVVRERIGELTLEVPVEELKNGGFCRIHIASLIPGDPVFVEKLPEATECYGVSVPQLEWNVFPWVASGCEGLVTDLHGWKLANWHMEKRKKMEE